MRSKAQRFSKVVYHCLWHYLIEFKYKLHHNFNLITHFQYLVSSAENSKTKFFQVIAWS